MWELQIWAWCLIFFGFLVIGAVIGFYVSRKKSMTKSLRKKPSC